MNVYGMLADEMGLRKAQILWTATMPRINFKNLVLYVCFFYDPFWVNCTGIQARETKKSGERLNCFRLNTRHFFFKNKGSEKNLFHTFRS